MKKLMNEQLPTPVIAPRSSPRDRVFRHMRDALAAGASVALLTGCPFGVVDPLPPPAQCRSMGADTLVQVVVTKREQDGGPPTYDVRVSHNPNAYPGSGLTDFATPTLTNATLVATIDTLRYEVAPTAGATGFELLIQAQCYEGREAGRRLGIKIVVALDGNGTATTTVTEVGPSDAG